MAVVAARYLKLQQFTYELLSFLFTFVTQKTNVHETRSFPGA